MKKQLLSFKILDPFEYFCRLPNDNKYKQTCDICLKHTWNIYIRHKRNNLCVPCSKTEYHLFVFCLYSFLSLYNYNIYIFKKLIKRKFNIYLYLRILKKILLNILMDLTSVVRLAVRQSTV